MPHAQIQMIAHAGHASFWDDATSFNQRLQEFAASVWSDQASVARTL
jgi:pimeloyl-ACP methyl ester carboxylesterase